MPTPFNYAGYDPFNQRVRGVRMPGTPQPTQPVQAASYPTAPTAPTAPTGAVPGLAPSAPVYQGPPVQSSGYYGQQTTPPAYSQQGSQSPGPTQGWPTAPQQQPQQQPPGQYYQQHPGGVTGQGQYQPQQGQQPQAQQPPTDRNGYIQSFYQNYLGRQASAPELASWGNQDLGQIGRVIQGSSEARIYSNSRAGMPQQTGQAPPQPAPQQAQFSPQAMPGWDQGKWSDPGKHDAKYDAGRLMSTLAPSVANIPQVLGMLQQAGHQVQYQGGDTAVIDGFTVDLVQGSHSGNPQWQWMVPQGAPALEQQTGGIDPYTAMFMQMMGGGPQFQGPPQQTAPQQGGADQTQLLQAIMQLLQNQASAPRGPVAPNFSFY